VQIAATLHHHQRSTVNLRPTNNPLINAPKNSTQFIIDDHEDSNLFWKFDAQPPPGREVEGGGAAMAAVRSGGRYMEEMVGGGQQFFGVGNR
jgi:hypothetical protein